MKGAVLLLKTKQHLLLFYFSLFEPFLVGSWGTNCHEPSSNLVSGLENLTSLFMQTLGVTNNLQCIYLGLNINGDDNDDDNDHGNGAN